MWGMIPGARDHPGARQGGRYDPGVGNLPLELTSFVGRDRELAEIRRLLASARAITLTGPGGVGKSRLAVRAGHKLSRHFPDGAWMVELADLDSPDLVPYAVARSMGVQERVDGPIAEALIAHLSERRALVLLDNCEHLLDACRALVTSLLSACPRVRVVCTSRERLDVPGEAIVAVSGLRLPGGTDPSPMGGLADAEALRLLIDRTVAVAPDFALTPENLEAATEICSRLDGLPLAIELAAVRLASMTAEDLRERLDDRLALLAFTNPTGPERGQTLRATVDWSHELLTDEERILWRRLSVFAGSFGLRAAEDVCAGAGLERAGVVDAVGSLVAKSILTMGHDSRRGRYRLLDTLRLYGAERLAEAGEEAALAAAHAAWYARRFSGGYRPWWGNALQTETLEELDVEWANVEAALDFFAGSEPDAEIGLRMATDLFLYWLVRGRYRAGCRRLETFLAMDHAHGRARVMAMWALGFLSQATGDYMGPLPVLQQARELCERTGGDREMGYVLHGLGLLYLRRGDTEQARELATQGCELMQRADDPVGLALLRCFLATLVIAAGRFDEAQRLAVDGLRASEHAGDRFMRGIACGLLGSVQWLRGDVAAAEASLREALRIQIRTGHRWGMLTTLESLAWVASSAGQLERAALLLGSSAALSQEFGVPLFPYGRAQAHHDACEANARAGLGQSRYRDCWERGYALSYEQAVATALEEAPDGADTRTAPGAREEGVLSARELEVARLVGDGLSNPGIAAELFVSVATVKTHVSHILGKLGLDSRVQLASWLAGHNSGQPPQDGR